MTGFLTGFCVHNVQERRKPVTGRSVTGHLTGHLTGLFCSGAPPAPAGGAEGPTREVPKFINISIDYAGRAVHARPGRQEGLQGVALGGRRGSRGCQGRTRLRKWLPFYVLSLPPGPLTC